MNHSSFSSFRLVASFALVLAACGGGGGDEASPSGAAGSAGSGSQNPDGKACTGPGDCPSGYACTTVAMSAYFPSGPCSLMQCEQLCAGDPQCIGECLMSECPGGPGAGGSSPGAGGSSASGPCASLCSKVASSCSPAEGSACEATCPALPPACVSCVSSAPDVCNPEAACSSVCGTGPSGTGGTGGSTKNVCKPTSTGTGGSGTAGSGTAGSGPLPIAWAGTWIANVQYEVACDVGAGNIKKASQSHAVTTTLSGANGSLTAMPGSGYEMTGLGNDGSLTLNGTFPFRDYGGETASGTVIKDNQGSIKVNSVTSDKAATGSIEGTFVGKFGAKCTVSGGSVSLSR